MALLPLPNARLLRSIALLFFYILPKKLCEEEDGLRSNDNIVGARPSTLQVRGATAFDFSPNTILRPPRSLSVVHSHVRTGNEQLHWRPATAWLVCDNTGNEKQFCKMGICAALRNCVLTCRWSLLVLQGDFFLRDGSTLKKTYSFYWLHFPISFASNDHNPACVLRRNGLIPQKK